MPGKLCCYEFNLLRIAESGISLKRAYTMRFVPVGYWDLADFEYVANNLRESFRVIAAARTKGEVCEFPGVSIASAGVTFQMFNSAFLSTHAGSEAEMKQRILLPNRHFNDRGLEWAYWVCLDWLDDVSRRRHRRLFEARDLRLSTELPGMLAERLLPPVSTLPRMEIRRVRDAAGSAAFCEIGSVCFHVPIPWFREVFDNDRVWERFASYVGYWDGEPVSTAAVVVGGGAIGVYNVATLPGSQRRGFGEAVMRHALAEARKEHRMERMVLQSTPAGLRLYERMGFRTITRVAVYSS
jgi:ribosomal protein S18 acetylase RimI-like enzyme